MEKFGLGITRYRWIPYVTGFISIVLGIWCFCSPASSVEVMAYFFAAMLCVAGVFNLAFAAFNHKVAPNWGWSLALGLLDLVAGIWMFCLPAAELAMTFVVVIGIWLVCVAINAICEMFVIGNRSVWLSVLSVLLLIVTIYFAIYVLSSPMTLAFAGWLYLGISLISYGIFRIIIGFRLAQISRATDGLI